MYKVTIKPVIILVAVALLIGAVGMLFISRGCRDQPRPSQSVGIPPGWVAPPVAKTPWLPFMKNKASEVTAGFPAGSKVVVIETPGGETAEVGILRGGQIVTKEGVKATVYESRGPLAEAEIRPFIGAGASFTPDGDINAAGFAGVDVLRVWRLHTGPALCVDSEAVAGAWTASVKLWRNVDARGGAGYGTAGPMGFAGVSIGIE